MRIPLLLAVFLLTAPALAESGAIDAIDTCRAAHVDDAAAHIACLETALRVRGGDAGPKPAADVSEQESPAEAAGARAELGAEHVQRKVERSGPARVRVIAATYNRQGLGEFRLEGGQLWRETMTSPAHLRLAPDTEYSARIEQTRLGGYRMYVDGIRWMKRIERLE
jgi:hypothetical protein